MHGLIFFWNQPRHISGGRRFLWREALSWGSQIEQTTWKVWIWTYQLGILHIGRRASLAIHACRFLKVHATGLLEHTQSKLNMILGRIRRNNKVIHLTEVLPICQKLVRQPMLLHGLLVLYSYIFLNKFNLFYVLNWVIMFVKFIFYFVWCRVNVTNLNASIYLQISYSTMIG